MKDKVATKNSCKLCSPLGASVALKGIEGCMPLLHGSQGCATYIRRYMISHFNEPVDIASSSFTEDTTIFGGQKNLEEGLDNIVRQYEPISVGVATTCLTETIGENVNMYLYEILAKRNDNRKIFAISTPSYQGSHVEGFHKTVESVIKNFANSSSEEKTEKLINILPNFVSPADIRYLKRVLSSFELNYIMLPDYSESLDSGFWDSYHKIPPGGTTFAQIERMGDATHTIDLSPSFETGGKYLEKKFSVTHWPMALPIGVKLTDTFFDNLKKLTEKNEKTSYRKARERLIDSYADGHKYISGLKAVIYGEEDFVISLASFLNEIGIFPAVVATGGTNATFQNDFFEINPDLKDKDITLVKDVDFGDIEEYVADVNPDLLLGNSKGHKIAEKFEIPLIRMGFPIHDRIGGQRILHLGYEGAQQLFDIIVNTVIAKKQKENPYGYFYM